MESSGDGARVLGERTRGPTGARSGGGAGRANPPPPPPPPSTGGLPKDVFFPHLGDGDPVIAWSAPNNPRISAACPRLKIVSRCGVGTDSVDMTAAAQAGVVATNTPGAMAEAVADFAFGL